MRNRLYGWIACWCLCLIAPAALARAVDNAAVPVLPASLLVDQVGALNDTERAALEDRLQALQASGRAQAAIFISNGTHGETLTEFSLRVAETWQLGRAGRNDGLLILVIPSARSARIEVGYGLEGDITDALSSQWLDELLPAIKHKELASGLNHLLDQVDGTLPKSQEKADTAGEDNLLDAHPEWKLPFVFVVFSPFAIFPMFAGRWGSLASGPLLAAFLGSAAFMLWDSQTAGFAVAGVTLPLPFLWGLNWFGGDKLPHWLRYGKVFGNLIAVVLFFSVITLFVGVGLSVGGVEQIWAAPIFAGLFATGLAAFLFPGEPARYLMIGLRSAMHFVFILVVAYVALGPFVPNPAGIAFAAAGTVTASAALGLYLESRSEERTRWSILFYWLALLVALPFVLLALVSAVVGDDLQKQLTQGAVGGGSLTAILWLAARFGLLAAMRVGLGGLFGGGGAGRSG